MVLLKLWWHHQEADGQIFERGKTMEFWSSTVLDHSNLIYTPISIRDVDRKKTTFEPSPSSSSIGHNIDTSMIHKELLRRQPTTSTSTGATELEPGQPVFVKEVHGNVWRTATIDQPAAEPDSYWVRFPDNSILRRTRSMIKPRSLPSHFELQAEAQQRNFQGETSSRSHTSFHQLNGQSMLPVTPMTSVTTPATIDRDSQVGAIPNPITGATSPTSDRGSTPSPVTTPRRSTQSTKGVPPVRYTPSRK